MVSNIAPDYSSVAKKQTGGSLESPDDAKLPDPAFATTCKRVGEFYQWINVYNNMVSAFQVHGAVPMDLVFEPEAEPAAVVPSRKRKSDSDANRKPKKTSRSKQASPGKSNGTLQSKPSRAVDVKLWYVPCGNYISCNQNTNIASHYRSCPISGKTRQVLQNALIFNQDTRYLVYVSSNGALYEAHNEVEANSSFYKKAQEFVASKKRQKSRSKRKGKGEEEQQNEGEGGSSGDIPTSKPRRKTEVVQCIFCEAKHGNSPTCAVLKTSIHKAFTLCFERINTYGFLKLFRSRAHLVTLFQNALPGNPTVEFMCDTPPETMDMLPFLIFAHTQHDRSNGLFYTEQITKEMADTNGLTFDLLDSRLNRTIQHGCYKAPPSKSSSSSSSSSSSNQDPEKLLNEMELRLMFSFILYDFLDDILTEYATEHNIARTITMNTFTESVPELAGLGDNFATKLIGFIVHHSNWSSGIPEMTKLNFAANTTSTTTTTTTTVTTSKKTAPPPTPVVAKVEPQPPQTPKSKKGKNGKAGAPAASGNDNSLAPLPPETGPGAIPRKSPKGSVPNPPPVPHNPVPRKAGTGGKSMGRLLALQEEASQTSEAESQESGSESGDEEPESSTPAPPPKATPAPSPNRSPKSKAGTAQQKQLVQNKSERAVKFNKVNYDAFLERQREWYLLFGIKKTTEEILELDQFWPLNNALLSMGLVTDASVLPSALVSGIKNVPFDIRSDLRALQNEASTDSETSKAATEKIGQWVDVLQEVVNTAMFLKVMATALTDKLKKGIGKKYEEGTVLESIKLGTDQTSFKTLAQPMSKVLDILFVQPVSHGEHHLNELTKIVMEALRAGWFFWPQRDFLAQSLGVVIPEVEDEIPAEEPATEEESTVGYDDDEEDGEEVEDQLDEDLKKLAPPSGALDMDDLVG